MLTNDQLKVEVDQVETILADVITLIEANEARITASQTTANNALQEVQNLRKELSDAKAAQEKALQERQEEERKNAEQYRKMQEAEEAQKQTEIQARQKKLDELKKRVAALRVGDQPPHG